MQLDNHEIAIILAGLRTVQRIGVAPPEMDIATDGGDIDVMSDDDIDVLIDRIIANDDVASHAFPVIANAEHWAGAAESHRDAMRAAGTTSNNSLDERKARAADAVAAALGEYAKLTNAAPPAVLTDWHAIARDLAGALAGAVEQIGQLKGMFHDDDGEIQKALDDADEAMTTYQAPPAGLAPAHPIIVVMEGGLCQTVVSDDPAMIGKPYSTVDYEIEGSDNVSQVLQSNGKSADACIGGGTIERATITVPPAAI